MALNYGICSGTTPVTTLGPGFADHALLVITTTSPAGCIIQSDFGAGPHRNSEAVVPLHLNDGAIELRHFFHDNRDVCLPWTKTQFITQSCAGLGGIIQSSFDSGTHGNFEVLVEERRGAVVHYWHPNLHVEESWIRTDCFDTFNRILSLPIAPRRSCS